MTFFRADTHARNDGVMGVERESTEVCQRPEVWGPTEAIVPWVIILRAYEAMKGQAGCKTYLIFVGKLLGETQGADTRSCTSYFPKNILVMLKRKIQSEKGNIMVRDGSEGVDMSIEGRVVCGSDICEIAFYNEFCYAFWWALDCLDALWGRDFMQGAFYFVTTPSKI